MVLNYSIDLRVIILTDSI